MLRACSCYTVTAQILSIPQVKSGTLVVLHGANVHMSYENRSPHSRHAFSLHVAEGACLAKGSTRRL